MEDPGLAARRWWSREVFSSGDESNPADDATLIQEEQSFELAEGDEAWEEDEVLDRRPLLPLTPQPLDESPGRRKGRLKRVGRALSKGLRRKKRSDQTDVGDWSMEAAEDERSGPGGTDETEESLRGVLATEGPAPAHPANPYSDSYSYGLEKRDWQVSFTVIEGRLGGAALSPTVSVQVGAQKQLTSTKHDTQNPEWNEYGVFDFRLASAVFFDQLITIRILHSKNVLSSSEVFASFTLDVATVYAQPAQQFYHKWAVLVDPSDLSGGPKGFLKLNIAVSGAGEAPLEPVKSSLEDADEDNIDANLLLPAGSPSTQQQQSRFLLRVGGVSGLEAPAGGIVGVVKRAMSFGPSPPEAEQAEAAYFVQASFAGHVGKTSVARSGEGRAEWDEELVFVDWFPPLVRRLRLSLWRERGLGMGPNLVATAFLDLGQISDPGPRGYLPTFGPSLVFLYASPSEAGGQLSLPSASSALLDQGLGEGVAFKGRLLVQFRVETLSRGAGKIPSGVSVQKSPPMTAAPALGQEKRFLLFGCIMGVNMIDKRYIGKELHLEVSMGRAGLEAPEGSASFTEGGASFAQSPSGSEWSLPLSRTAASRSTTPRLVASPDCHEIYASLNHGEERPLVSVFGRWGDTAWRLAHHNFLSSLAVSVEGDLERAGHLVELDHTERALKALHSLLDKFMMDAAKYIRLSDSITAQREGLNELDRHKLRVARHTMERLTESLRKIKSHSSQDSVERRLKVLERMPGKLRDLATEPQQSLPDVLIWLMCGPKRIAYHRIKAADLLHSPEPLSRGSLCGKLSSFYLKLGGRQTAGESQWRLQGQVSAAFWLGDADRREGILEALPTGHRPTAQLGLLTRPSHSSLPASVQFPCRYHFELRSHLYQARHLLASDCTGLSDPFARVLFQGHSAISRFKPQTLNPCWDETLVLPNLALYTNPANSAGLAQTIVVEIFDKDKIGDGDFIGQALGVPSVKLLDEPYTTPKLRWTPVYRGSEPAGEILAAFELIQVDSGTRLAPRDVPPLQNIDLDPRTPGGPPVPFHIRPALGRYRLEVLFWGLRDLGRVNLLSVARPQMELELAGCRLVSPIVPSYKTNPNFSDHVRGTSILLPQNPEFWPAIELRCVDRRSFGRDALVGAHTLSALPQLLSSQTESCHDSADEEAEMLRQSDASLDDSDEGSPPQVLDWWSKFFASLHHHQTLLRDADKPPPKRNSVDLSTSTTLSQPIKSRLALWGSMRTKALLSSSSPAPPPPAPLSKRRARARTSISNLNAVARLVVYPCELEAVGEFGGFTDVVSTYPLYRGVASASVRPEDRVTGKFKGQIRISRLEEGAEEPPLGSLFPCVPANELLQVLVRVYVVAAKNLHPADSNGKADPYLSLSLGRHRLSDRDNYISKQLNPVFGKLFELTAVFPQESKLRITVKDWDLVSADDVIGETEVDLESRFYSHHRAQCGLPESYATSGYNAWRDSLKPSAILEQLCKRRGVSAPKYSPPSHVRVGGKLFLPAKGRGQARDWEASKEDLALQVLRRWAEVPGSAATALVPEHVETRPLYNPSHPGLVMGRLQMWIDMFPLTMRPPPPVDISPRKPKAFELRVVIWNTEDVVLDDEVLLTGEKMSDIYVKGWLHSAQLAQATDVHYRSLTGEGNFNWRFVFPFHYLEAEERIVWDRKESFFSIDKTQEKLPPVLRLQVWDADYVLPDDFLGSLELRLNDFPRGSKTAAQCHVGLLDDAPRVSLFQQRRIKGWWPMANPHDPDGELTGKVEMELELLTGAEAEATPAGLGRSEPAALPEPSRPDDSFVWLTNPLKSLRFVVWRNHKALIVYGVLAVLFLLLFVLFIYSVPGYVAKRLVGA